MSGKEVAVQGFPAVDSWGGGRMHPVWLRDSLSPAAGTGGRPGRPEGAWLGLEGLRLGACDQNDGAGWLWVRSAPWEGRKLWQEVGNPSPSQLANWQITSH